MKNFINKDLADYLVYNSKTWKSFNSRWKDDYSLIPDVIVFIKEQEKIKKIVETVYNKIIDSDYIQELIELSYKRGYNDGLNSNENLIDDGK